jgi:acyl carrier protein
VHTAFEKELALLLITALDLEDVGLDDMAPEAPLFGFSEPGSLGLDSIDALEISLAIGKQYGVQLKADDEQNAQTFRSLRNLAQYIEANKPA